MMNCREPLPVCVAHLEYLKEEMSKVSEAVLGNGNPKQGLVARMEAMEARLSATKWFVATLLVVIGLTISAVAAVNAILK